MSELLYFIGFLHVKWLHKRVFPVCESKIGANLRKGAKDSMEDVKLCEVTV